MRPKSIQADAASRRGQLQASSDGMMRKYTYKSVALALSIFLIYGTAYACCARKQVVSAIMADGTCVDFARVEYSPRLFGGLTPTFFAFAHGIDKAAVRTAYWATTKRMN